ncbi:hypothetical protein [Cellulomonas phragmiteti]|uniref:Uncharacterized protein n=1 Tax=Cellulomonas phragmiteti TaxID=478780 RepID=A0ABQ4DNK9_9CELL|nr:hypothetical protein [Cellulomonas phragmiteti]GIG40934.1 hypothetical protein Cph01nite_26960 [Cellulomonas phragmiteti]
MSEGLIGIPSDDVTLDVDALVAAALARWPGASTYRYESGVVELTLSDPERDARLDLAFHAGGQAVGLDGWGAELAADAVAWLVRAADVPPEAGAVLVGWGSDAVPLDRSTTTEGLLAVNAAW